MRYTKAARRSHRPQHVRSNPQPTKEYSRDCPVLCRTMKIGRLKKRSRETDGSKEKENEAMQEDGEPTVDVEVRPCGRAACWMPRW